MKYLKFITNRESPIQKLKSNLQNKSCCTKTYVKAWYRAWYDTMFVGEKAPLHLLLGVAPTCACFLIYLTDFLPSQFLTQGHFILGSHARSEIHAWLI